MEPHLIFQAISETTKRTEKEKLLKDNDSPLLREILEYTYNPYKQYHVLKISPKTEFKRNSSIEEMWQEFFTLLDRLDAREITGNDAVNEVETFIGSVDEETAKWMEKVLQGHLNIGITASTINKVFKGLVPTFKVQLAHKFEAKRVEKEKLVATEPKLDGVRCIAIVKNGHAILHSRNGKVIGDNYKSTIIADLNRLATNNRIPKYVVFDGELMGSDFTATVSQIHRKTNADIKDHYYHIFDWMPYEDWVNQNPTLTCQEMREKLEDMALDIHSNYLKLVHRDIVPPEKIKAMHDIYVADGYEGAMIKTLHEKYKFGRGHNVVKLKDFYDKDLEVVSFEEGTGKYDGMLGAIIVKNGDVFVNVGSGFSDDERKQIWENRSNFRNHIAEIRYQEETSDGSLRFPTFRGWRPDKKNSMI